MFQRHATKDWKFEDGTSLEFTIGSSGVALITVVDPKWRIPTSTYAIPLQELT